MKIAPPRLRRRNLVGITPLIDVVFIMLFFFMLASSFDRWQTLDLTLITGRAPAAQPAEVQTLVVRAAAEVRWHGQWLALDDLMAQLVASERDLSLVLQPLPDTPVQDLVQVLERVRASGRHRVALAVAR